MQWDKRIINISELEYLGNFLVSLEGIEFDEDKRLYFLRKERSKMLSLLKLKIDCIT